PRRRVPVSSKLESLDYPGDRYSGVPRRDVCDSLSARDIAEQSFAVGVGSRSLRPGSWAGLFKKRRPQNVSASGFVGRFLRTGFGWFNRGFERLSNGYGDLTGRLVRGVAIVLVIYVALVGVAGLEFWRSQTGFIPEQDQGYLITIVQLPPGA